MPKDFVGNNRDLWDDQFRGGSGLLSATLDQLHVQENQGKRPLRRALKVGASLKDWQHLVPVKGSDIN
jgi:hypothetical protein